MDPPHLIMTYTALLALAILRDDFSQLNRGGLIGLIRATQREDGRCVHSLPPPRANSDSAMDATSARSQARAKQTSEWSIPHLPSARCLTTSAASTCRAPSRSCTAVRATKVDSGGRPGTKRLVSLFPFVFSFFALFFCFISVLLAALAYIRCMLVNDLKKAGCLRQIRIRPHEMRLKKESRFTRSNDP